jgi:mono/diheme cytochrome c family protein
MRYFLLIFGLCVVAVMGIAGKRGSLSRNTPLYVFADMDRQLKLRPQVPNQFFANGMSSQLPVAGTIARSQPLQTADGPVYPYEDAPVVTGYVTGTTNFVEHSPFQMTVQLLERGRERYQIFCAPCHSGVGDGNGITKRIGSMPVVANLHDQRIVAMTDGELYHVISAGRNLMGAYAASIPIEDRWAIVAYMRALQRSHLGTLEDLPQELRGTLRK